MTLTSIVVLYNSRFRFISRWVKRINRSKLTQCCLLETPCLSREGNQTCSSFVTKERGSQDIAPAFVIRDARSGRDLFKQSALNNSRMANKFFNPPFVLELLHDTASPAGKFNNSLIYTIQLKREQRKVSCKHWRFWSAGLEAFFLRWFVGSGIFFDPLRQWSD